MKRVKVGTQGIKVIMEGARKAKVMKGKRLLEEVQFEDGDDLVAAVDALESTYASDLQESDESGSEGDGTSYAVVLLGGSIGEDRPRTLASLDGVEVRAKDTLFDSIESAKAKAVRMNKLLTPGEKSYYKMKYVVVEVENGRFVTSR